MFAKCLLYPFIHYYTRPKNAKKTRDVCGRRFNFSVSDTTPADTVVLLTSFAGTFWLRNVYDKHN